MTDEKSEPACRWCREPAERHLGKLKLCPAGGALSFHAFTPAKPEAKEATDADFELRATCPHGFSYIEDCDRCPWSPGAKEVEPTDRAWMRAAIKTLQSERDAAIERAEKAQREADACGETLKLCRENIDELCVSLAAVTAERDEWRQAKGEEIEYSNRLELERDKMRPVIEAARSVVAKLLAEIRREGVTAQWAYKREYVALIDAVDALDAAKPAEPTPAQCSGKCKWDDGAGEGPGYSYGDADCPVHGVERAKHSPACSVCNDTHVMQVRERGVPCTACPVPCENCRANGSGAYCREPSCDCGCHENLAAEVPGESARPGCPKCGSTNPRHRHDAPFVVSAAEITPPAVDPRDAIPEES